MEININSIISFSVIDERNYVADLSHNGGCYAFYEEWKRFPEGWRVQRTNSSEFVIGDCTFEESSIYTDEEVIAEFEYVESANDPDFFITDVVWMD